MEAGPSLVKRRPPSIGSTAGTPCMAFLLR
jgi:hypothetical protein